MGYLLKKHKIYFIICCLWSVLGIDFSYFFSRDTTRPTGISSGSRNTPVLFIPIVMTAPARDSLLQEGHCQRDCGGTMLVSGNNTFTAVQSFFKKRFRWLFSFNYCNSFFLLPIVYICSKNTIIQVNLCP